MASSACILSVIVFSWDTNKHDCLIGSSSIWLLFIYGNIWPACHQERNISTLVMLNLFLRIIYLHFISFLNIEIKEIFKNHSTKRPTTCLLYSQYSWLLMAWRQKEPEHQQPWCWPSYPKIFGFNSEGLKLLLMTGFRYHLWSSHICL